MKILTSKHWKLIAIGLSLLALFLLRQFTVGERGPEISTRKDNVITETLKPTTPITPIKYETVSKQYQGTPRIVSFLKKQTELVQNNEYFNKLKNNIANKELSAQAWFSNRCNEFWLGYRDNEKYVSIERHGYHQNGCPGDPETSPRYDTFLIDTRTEEVFYDNVMTGKTITFEEWAKGVAKE